MKKKKKKPIEFIYCKDEDSKYPSQYIFQLEKYPKIKKFLCDYNINIYNDNLHKNRDDSKNIADWYWLFHQRCESYKYQLKINKMTYNHEKNPNRISLNKIIQMLDVIPNETNHPYFNMIKKCNSVCVHFRLGDDLNKSLIQQNIDDIFKWYREKILTIQKEEPNSVFFIFTNDTTGLVKKELKSLKKVELVYVEVNKAEDAVQELNLMRNCKKFILGWGGFAELAFYTRNNKNGYAYKYWPSRIDFINNKNHFPLCYKIFKSNEWEKYYTKYLRYSYKIKKNILDKFKLNPMKFIASIPSDYVFNDKFY